MYKEKILESIRHLYLDENQILAIAGVLPTVTNLERETFFQLCSERKTLERIQHMLQKGKPLRN